MPARVVGDVYFCWVELVYETARAVGDVYFFWLKLVYETNWGPRDPTRVMHATSIHSKYLGTRVTTPADRCVREFQLSRTHRHARSIENATTMA